MGAPGSIGEGHIVILGLSSGDSGFIFVAECFAASGGGLCLAV